MKRYFLCAVMLLVLTSCGAAPDGTQAPDALVDNSRSGATASGAQSHTNTDAKDPMLLSPPGQQQFNAGLTAGASGQLDQAEQAFQQVTRTDPDAPHPYYNLGVVSERRGADLKALNLYQQAIQKKADYYPALSAAAKLLLRYGKRDQAVQMLRTASGKASSNIKIIVLYADVLTGAQRYEEAIQVAKRALRLDERSAEAMLQIGKANLRMGRLELAEAIFNQVLSINDRIAEVYFLQGLLELEKGVRILAIRKFEKAVEINPFYPEALNNLAVEYMYAGNYSSALPLLERAMQITPSWGIIYLNYGNALRGAGNWKRALAVFQRAEKMLPGSAAITFNMAVLYYAADELGGLSRLARLQKARALFAKYKAQRGKADTDVNDDEAIRYIKELDVLIEREQVRMQRQREAAAREKERQKPSAPVAEPSGTDAAGAAEIGDDDDGWE
ncbi:MAG: tetratricopeptide repeat protein [Deltaproteobacteria bacterium]|nr:tetratricopeptide repeat protein [Deltaproteobacteria bacterium]